MDSQLLENYLIKNTEILLIQILINELKIIHLGVKMAQQDMEWDNPLVPGAHHSERRDRLWPELGTWGLILISSLIKSEFWDYIFYYQVNLTGSGLFK